MMINSLGLLEVYGFVASVEAMDAMLKTSNVRLLSHKITPPALVTIVIEGDLAACRVAVDSGAVAAEKLGKVICRKVIGRPVKDTENIVLSFCDETEHKPEPVSKPKNVEAEIDVEIIEVDVETVDTFEENRSGIMSENNEINNVKTFLQKRGEKGANLTEILGQLKIDRETLKVILNNCVHNKELRKKRSRYYFH